MAFARAADGTAALNRDLERDRDEIRADLKEAYERGRRDERAGRRRHPVGMTLMTLAAAAGVVSLGLAAVNGSFADGGAVIDQTLRSATSSSGG